MSTLIRFTPKSSVTKDQYEEVQRKLDETGDWMPEGLDYHVAFGTNDKFRVSEIWDSKEEFETFSKRLMPVLKEAGIELSGPPEMLEIVNIEKR